MLANYDLSKEQTLSEVYELSDFFRDSLSKFESACFNLLSPL